MLLLAPTLVGLYTSTGSHPEKIWSARLRQSQTAFVNRHRYAVIHGDGCVGSLPLKHTLSKVSEWHDGDTLTCARSTPGTHSSGATKDTLDCDAGNPGVWCASVNDGPFLVGLEVSVVKMEERGGGGVLSILPVDASPTSASEVFRPNDW